MVLQLIKSLAEIEASQPWVQLQKKIKPFGKIAAENFRQQIEDLFGGEYFVSWEVTGAKLSEMAENFPDYREDLVTAFREFLLDEFMTLSEKASVYLGAGCSENEAYAEFKECWEALAPDKPWPLDPGAMPPLVVPQPNKPETKRPKGVTLPRRGR